MAEPDPTLTAAEVAKLCGVARTTLKQWRFRGTGPTYFRLTTTKNRGPIRYRKSDVDAWLEQRRIAAIEQKPVSTLIPRIPGTCDARAAETPH